MEKPSRFRVRWTDNGVVREVVATAFPIPQTAHVTLPGGGFTADVVMARAIPMLLSHVVYSVLQPDGPYLLVEAEYDGRWVDLRELPR